LTLSLFLLFLPLHTYASKSPPTKYTIQAGSFTVIAHAHEQFDSITQQLNEKELDYLRIEKVGKFYSVRLGKFDDRVIAEKYLQAIKPHLSTAIILKAYIKDEKFIRLYTGLSSVGDIRVRESPSPSPVPDKIEEPAEHIKEKAKKTEEPKEEEKAYEREAKGIFMEGLRAFKAQQFEKAREKFQTLSENYSENEYTENAHYWIGECFYWEQKYLDAIVNYTEFLKEYPNSDNAPVALLKEGLSLYALKNEISGKAVLEKLIKQFPDSIEALQAKKKLNLY
jgi:tol-pal system protein YbgF